VTIARQGWPVIASVAFTLAVVAVVGVAAGHPVSALPFFLGTAFSFWFYRDPERVPPPDESLVVSPADGRVLDVTPGHETQYLGGQAATRISIFMSPLDVHVNRNPVSGAVTLVRHTAGKFAAAFKDKASLDNERNAVVIDRGGRRFLFIQIAGAVARRIVCQLQPGEQVQRGARMGLIMFGSRVDVWLPPDVTPRVKAGDRVSAGTSVLGEIPKEVR
jgi:phosphatidylserine decarboxylase